MANFFEKLKKGMDIEELIEDEVEGSEEKTDKPANKENPAQEQPLKKKMKTKKPQKEAETEEKETEEEEIEEEKEEEEKLENKKEEKKEKDKEKKKSSDKEKTEIRKLEIKEIPIEEEPEGEKGRKEKWSLLSKGQEGELAVDIYQTENDLVVQSAIAGVKPENLDVSLEKDLITIKGYREKPFKEKGDYFSQECFWGAFSKEIISPVEIDSGRAEAKIKEGVLTIRIPKIKREQKTKISVKNI